MSDRSDSSTTNGPQTARAQVILAASPSNSLESACQKARSRSRAVLRPAVSTVREVSAGSGSRARPPTGIVAWHAGCHHAAQDRRRTRRLPTPSTRDHRALRGRPRQHRDPVRRDRRRGACGPHPSPCPERTPRLSRLRASLWPKARLRARGFARLKCRACSETRLVAFSCKGRGFCPSCMGRRMSGASGPLGERKAWPWATTAANLIERVLPPSTPLWPKARLRAGSGC